MIVRQMRPEELDITANLFKYYAAEAAEAEPRFGEEFDIDSTVASIRSRTIYPQQTWLNLYDRTRPVGFITGSVSSAPWNSRITFAHIEMFYIMQSHRNIDSFRQLIAAFEEWSNTFEPQHISVSDAGVDPERTKKLFEHIGFKPQTFLTKAVQDGVHI